MKRTTIYTALALALTSSVSTAYGAELANSLVYVPGESTVALDNVNVKCEGATVDVGSDELTPGGFLVNFTKEKVALPGNNTVVVNGTTKVELKNINFQDPKGKANWNHQANGLGVKSTQNLKELKPRPSTSVTYKKAVDVTMENSTVGVKGKLNGISNYQKCAQSTLMTFEDDVNVTIKGVNTAQAAAPSSEVFVTGVSAAYGVTTFKKDLKINIEDSHTKRTRGLWTGSGGTQLIVDGKATVTGHFENREPANHDYDSAAFYVNGSGSGANKPGITVGSAHYEGDKDDGAIFVKGKNAHFTLKGDGTSVIKGRTTHYHSGTIDLSFKDKDSLYRSNISSYHWGAKKRFGDLPADDPEALKRRKGMVINLKFENAAKWEVIDQVDWITTLDLTDGGKVVFDNTEGTVGKELRLENFVSTTEAPAKRGSITFTTDLANKTTDWLHIRNQDADSTNFLTANIDWTGNDSDALYLESPLIVQNNGTLTVLNKDNENKYLRNGTEDWHLTFVPEAESATFDFTSEEARKDTTKTVGTGAGKWYLMRAKPEQPPVVPPVTPTQPGTGETTTPSTGGPGTGGSTAGSSGTRPTPGGSTAGTGGSTTGTGGTTPAVLPVADASHVKLLPNALWWGDIDTYDERVGGLYANSPNRSLWLRLKGDLAKDKKPNAKTRGVMAQFGAERALGDSFWRGTLFGEARQAKSTFDDEDSIKLKRWGVGLILTRSEEQVYWDFVARWAHDKFTIRNQNESVSVKGNNLYLSAETGRRFINKRQWFAEPQLQVTYTRQTLKDYALAGQTVKTDALSGIGVRLGVKLGVDRARYKLWVRGDLLPRFGSSNTTTVAQANFASETLSSRQRGLGWDVGVGGSRFLNPTWRVAGSAFLTKMPDAKPSLRAQVSVQKLF